MPAVDGEPATGDEREATGLHAEAEGAGPRLVLVHGFTQTRRSWGPLAGDLATDHQVVRVDLPGHGGSARVLAGLRGGARLLGDAGGAATYVGYSMGGRFCLQLALANPELVRGLVLVGATGGIDDPAERVARLHADEGMATRVETEGVAAVLDAWLALPLFAGLSPEAAGREARLENTPAGLASSLRMAGAGSQDPMWARLGRLTVPVLVTAGERDEKFTALAHRLVASIGDNATLAIVPDAGHAAHLEQPAAFLGILRPWLAAHGL